MRTQPDSGPLKILKNLTALVNKLAAEPSYKNLLSCMTAIYPNLSRQETELMEEALRGIEDGILKGYSTRRELVFDQIKHGGGVGEGGITPYISASFDPAEAMGYSREGIMVIDIPASELESLDPASSETRIKGVLDKKYITALLPRKASKGPEENRSASDLHKVLEIIQNEVDVDLLEGDSLAAVLAKQSEADKNYDQKQWPIDVELVRQRRAASLARNYSELNIDIPALWEGGDENNVDIYIKE